MRTVETDNQKKSSSEGKSFDLRGLLAQCVKGNAAWLDRFNGYVKARVAAKVFKGEFACPMPLSDR